MSGIAGHFGQPSLSSEAQHAMAETLSRHDASAVASLSDGRAWLALASLAKHFILTQHAGTLLAICGHPRFEGHSSAEALAQAIIDAHQREGVGFLTRMRGDFALALIDLNKREVVLAVDRAAICALTYAEVGTSLSFGSNADAVRAAVGTPTIDPQALYDYLYFHMIPASRTIYREVKRLGPGECLVHRNGKAQVSRYWEPHYDEHVDVRFDALRDELHRTIQTAVARAAADADSGAFLSGGTDSSTLAGMLGKIGSRAAHTYSIGFAAAGYDEMEYARIAARHFGTEQHEYYVTPDDIVTAVPKIAAIYDQPFGNASAVPTYYCAKLAKETGRERLLGGDGGDELFGGNARYATQSVLDIYGKLPRVMRHVLEPSLGIAPAFKLVKKARSYIAQASMPMPARYESYNLLERLGVANVLHPDFRASIDPSEPLRQMSKVYQRANAATLINRMLALDYKYTLADNDLPKVTRMCELAGVDVAFPLLDEDVVDFAARLAPGLKLKGTQLRYFFKKSMRGFLPEEILKKSKHGFGLPFGLWLREHAGLREFVSDTLMSLKARRLIAPGFIEELVDRRINEHAAYYGTMVWILMMLEQWLSAHGIDQTVS